MSGSSTPTSRSAPPHTSAAVAPTNPSTHSTGDAPAPSRLGLPRITALTVGDYACNLFWQSVTLFLFFYYTDAVGLSAAAAGIIYMIASIWDGASDPIMGVIVDRTRSKWGRYRPYILLGAVPLGVSFALLYYRPPMSGWSLVAVLVVTHLLFRTCYTAVSIPYTSLSARLTSSSRDRSMIAGFRMIFATLAGMTVSLLTLPMVVRLGEGDDARGFFLAACVYSLIAIAIFPVVFMATREQQSGPSSERRIGARDYWANLRVNRAFWIVMIGIVCAAGCLTILGKTVMYYYKYYLNDEAAARYALSLMAGSGLAIMPLWMFVERYTGKRGAWLLATLLGLAGVTYFASIDVRTVPHMTAYLVAMQVPVLGLAMLFWAMLPDTVEYGEWRSGVRAESFSFGLGQFFLKVALGVAAGVFGLSLDAVGFVPNIPQSADTLQGMKSIMVVVPAVLLVLGGVAMYFYPMRRGEHDVIVRELANRRRTSPAHSLNLSFERHPL